MSARLQDWRIRLGSYLSECARKPFVYGFHDCALFLAGAVEAMTGEDYAADYRGKYNSLEQGSELLQAAGHADHVALAKDCLKRIPAKRARMGDGAVVSSPEGYALGVVQNDAVAVLTPRGLGFVDVSEIKFALKV